MTRLGILGCADIAERRFMPAAKEIGQLKVLAVAEEYDISKLEPFCQKFSLEKEQDFKRLICREDMDAVYVPQPPALHYKWAKYALEHGKHVLVEKPSTTEYRFTKELVDIARENHLVLHENYMFQYHAQLKAIKKLVEEKMIGEIRLIRADFGFPLREKNDFRYVKELGGGALLDAGGYAAKLASIFLGKKIRTDCASLGFRDDYEVDMFGSATFTNEKDLTCQIGFGMDNAYKCNLEIWGSEGTIFTNRIFTAPETISPVIVADTKSGRKEIRIEPDNHFRHSIEQFIFAIEDREKRNSLYDEILLQSRLLHEMRELADL